MSKTFAYTRENTGLFSPMETGSNGMANFAAISYDMQMLDDEFLSLEPDHRHVWLALLGIQWPQCGIFKGGVSALVTATGRPRDVILAAMGAFEHLGWIARDGDYTWICGWIKHRGHNSNWKRGAIDEARCLIGTTSLAAKCVERYETASNGVERRSTASDAESKYSTVKQRTDSKEQPVSPAAARPGGGNGKPRQRAPEPEQYVALATEIDWYIRERIQKYNVAHGRLINDPQRCATELRLLVEADGYPLDSILPCLAWAWTYEFKGEGGALLRYGAQLLSMMQWRNGTPGKFDKLWKQWHQHTPGYCKSSSETGEKLRAAIQRGMQVKVND